MKSNILKLFVLLVFLQTSGIVRSQDSYGFAGKDQYVFFDPDSKIAEVKLGKSDYSNDVYYVWDTWNQPDDGMCQFDDYYISNPTVTFYEPGEYVFKCTQVSKYGHKKEYVVINVQSRVELVSVKVKNDKCFTNGYGLSRNDFEIETLPPGCEEFIRVAYPDIIQVPENNIWPLSLCNVTFTSVDENGDDYLCDISCMIPVTDPTQFISYEKMKTMEVIPSEVEEYVDKIDETFGGIKRLECLTDPSYILPSSLGTVVANGSTIGLSAYAKNTGWAVWGVLAGLKKKVAKLSKIVDPFPIAFDTGGEMNKLGYRLECQDGKQIPEVYFDGKFHISLGVSVDVPIPYISIPKVGGVHLAGEIMLGATIENHTSYPMNTKYTDLKIPVNFSLSSSIGLAALFLTQDVLSTSLWFKGVISVDSYLNFNSIFKSVDTDCDKCWQLGDNVWDYDKLNVGFYIVVKVVTMGFSIVNETIPLTEINSKEGVVNSIFD